MIHKLSIKALVAALALSMLAGCAGIGPGYKDSIRLEHVAINVPDPIAMTEWYCDNLGMKVKREGPPPVNMRFISDAGGNMMLELYNNPEGKVPDYKSMDPLSLHIAFHVDDVPAVRRRLLAAGATAHNDVETTPAGDVITMLRDPWGVPIQFLTRAEPMLK
ncbi:MAG: VOC family protein [Sedimentisphaerales bacterium]|nr:VOC family protein [Sedimentisphaerales bacterium]